MLGNWTDGHMSCRHSAPTCFLVVHMCVTSSPKMWRTINFLHLSPALKKEVMCSGRVNQFVCLVAGLLKKVLNGFWWIFGGGRVGQGPSDHILVAIRILSCIMNHFPGFSTISRVTFCSVSQEAVNGCENKNTGGLGAGFCLPSSSSFWRKCLAAVRYSKSYSFHSQSKQK